MTRVIEAIFSHGVLQPLEALELPEAQRVQLTVQPINGAGLGTVDSLPEMAPTKREREAALGDLFSEIDRMDLHLRIRLPTRDELHERY
jgi:predicted DNA-binding antitoxin AbrB/MazE fold protein